MGHGWPSKYLSAFCNVYEFRKRKNCCPAPFICKAETRPSTEFSRSFYVACRWNISSRVRLFGSEPGDWISNGSGLFFKTTPAARPIPGFPLTESSSLWSLTFPKFGECLDKSSCEGRRTRHFCRVYCRQDLETVGSLVITAFCGTVGSPANAAEDVLFGNLLNLRIRSERGLPEALTVEFRQGRGICQKP